MAVNIHHKVTKAQRKIKTMLFFVSLCLCGFPAFSSETLTVAVASSLYPQAMQYSKQFEAKHDVAVRLVSGSTGRLYNQIKQGAPFDIFIAAGSQKIDLDKPHKAMGYGYLGVQLGNRFTTDLQELLQPNMHKIAIANPQIAPFGAAAKRLLQKRGMWKAVQPKLVYAQNAMQASMMVNQGLVDAAFVPVAESQSHVATIPYVAALLTSNKNSRELYESLEVKNVSK